MPRLVGHGKAKYTTGTRLGSSRGAGWERLLAERWRHDEGDLAAIEPRETEIIVMLDGRARTRRRGDGRIQFHEAVPGTVWLCPAGIREDMIHIYGEIREALHLYIPAAPLSRDALEELDIDPDQVRLRYDGGFRDPLIEQVAHAVLAELRDPAPAGRLLVDTLSSALAVHIMRHHSNLSAGAVAMPKADGALDPRRLRAVLDFIEAHLDRNLSLDELSRAAGLSAYHFARSFKAAVGRPPHAYVNERRIERAKILLARREPSIADVALSCGFCSQSHLTRAFKQATGTTPGLYRSMNF